MINISPTNENGEAHGYWETYYYHGKLMFKCYYINGNEFGYEEIYYDADKNVTLIFHL